MLDTNVLSELRKREGDSRVVAWAANQASTDLALSAVTVLELEIGILRKARTDPDQGAILNRWFETRVLAGFDGRILPVDLAAARRAAALHVPDPSSQHDALIAGTALAHGLTVVTRNTRDFARTGVDVINPWTSTDQPGPGPETPSVK